MNTPLAFDELKECPLCDGTGWLALPVDLGEFADEYECYYCDGSGYVEVKDEQGGEDD